MEKAQCGFSNGAFEQQQKYGFCNRNNQISSATTSSTTVEQATKQENILKHAIYEGRSYRTPCPDRCCRCCTDGTLLSYILYLILPWLVAASVGLMIALGLVLVAPYLHVKDFTATNCTVTKAYLDGTEKCSCGRYCQMSFPCLKILVTHGASEGQKVQLFDDEQELKKDTCTYKPNCQKHKEKSASKVEAFQSNWGIPNSKYTCLYNPDDPTEVIRGIKFSDEEMIHLFVWPSFVVVVGSAVVLVLFVAYGCMCYRICKNRCYRACVLKENTMRVPWGL